MTGLTRIVAFVSLITVVAAVTVGGSDSAAVGPIAAASQVANARA